MKIRIFPKKDTIRAMMVSRMEELMAQVDELNEAIPGMTDEEERDYAELLLKNSKQAVELVQETINVLDSHSPPEVMVELDWS